MIYLIGVTFNFAINNLPFATYLDKGSFLHVHVTDMKYQLKKKKIYCFLTLQSMKSNNII